MGNRTEFRIPTYTGEITLGIGTEEKDYIDEIRQWYVGASQKSSYRLLRLTDTN